MSNINKLLARLPGVKKAGDGKWMAKCPAHQDKSPSLSVKSVDGDTILIKCWAGCETHNVLSAIGLEFSDLFPEDNSFDRPKKPNAPHFSMYEMFPLLMQESMLLVIALNTLTNNPMNNRNFTKAELSEDDLRRIVQACETVFCINAENAQRKRS